MGEFQLSAGVEFIKALGDKDTITRVSNIDCRRNGDYKVNGHWIFGDTVLQEHPYLKSYATLAHEMAMAPNDLLAILRAFDEVRINEYRRFEQYHFFRVSVGFTLDRGYVHLPDPQLASTGLLPYFSRHLRMTRELAPGWYEVEGHP